MTKFCLFPLWFRHFFCAATKRFAFYLTGLFLLFVLFDYSLVWIKQNPVYFWENYTGLFFYRFEYFAPLAFLMAVIVSLHTNKKNLELLSLETAGISKSKILWPFASLALAIALFGYVNNQWFLPKTFPYIEKKQDQKSLHSDKLSFEAYTLSDQSTIAYQKTLQENLFQDFYWIHFNGEIWHAKTLLQKNDCYLGSYVDHLKQDEEGQWQKIASYATYTFPKSLDQKIASQPKQLVLPLTKYIEVLKDPLQRESMNSRALSTMLLHKLFNPLCSLLLLYLFALFFYLTSFRESLSLYLFSGLLAFLSFFSFTKACIIFSENYMIRPWIVFIAIPLGFLGLSYWKIQKVR